MALVDNFGDKRNSNGFDKRPTDAGRPKGKSLTTILRKKLFDESGKMVLNGVDELDDKGVPTGRKVNVSVAMINAEGVIMHYLKRMKKSDSILKDLMDRIDGKANQAVDITTGGESLNAMPPIILSTKKK